MILTLTYKYKQFFDNVIDMIDHIFRGNWPELEGDLVLFLREYFLNSDQLEEQERKKGLKALAYYVETGIHEELIKFLEEIEFHLLTDFEEILTSTKIPCMVEYMDDEYSDKAWVFAGVSIKKHTH